MGRFVAFGLREAQCGLGRDLFLEEEIHTQHLRVGMKALDQDIAARSRSSC
jgi:hypothetical protein